MKNRIEKLNQVKIASENAANTASVSAALLLLSSISAAMAAYKK